jgi:hypothetical protein
MKTAKLFIVKAPSANNFGRASGSLENIIDLLVRRIVDPFLFIKPSCSRAQIDLLIELGGKLDQSMGRLW